MTRPTVLPAHKPAKPAATPAPTPAPNPAATPAARSAARSGARSGATLATLAALTLVPLAGCGIDDPNAFPPVCAKVAILHDAADITVNDARGHDLTDMLVDGRITTLNGSCKPGKDGKTLDTSLTVGMQISRGPALKASVAAVPWFVAVARGERILDKQILHVPVTFPPNTDSVTVTTEPVRLLLPLPKGVTGVDYRIVVGYQLTPDELAVNRQRGAR